MLGMDRNNPEFHPNYNRFSPPLGDNAPRWPGEPTHDPDCPDIVEEQKADEEALQRFDDMWEKCTTFPNVQLTHFEWHLLLNMLEDKLAIVNRDNTQVVKMLERIASQLHTVPVKYV